jgi:hypothetical protein
MFPWHILWTSCGNSPRAGREADPLLCHCRYESLRWAGPSGTCCYSRRSVLRWMLVLVGLSGNTAKDYSILRNASPCVPPWAMRAIRIYMAHSLRAVLHG